MVRKAEFRRVVRAVQELLYAFIPEDLVRSDIRMRLIRKHSMEGGEMQVGELNCNSLLQVERALQFVRNPVFPGFGIHFALRISNADNRQREDCENHKNQLNDKHFG